MIYYVGGGSTREGHGLHLPSANGRDLCHIPDFRNLSINTTGTAVLQTRTSSPTTTETRSSPSSSRQFRLPPFHAHVCVQPIKAVSESQERDENPTNWIAHETPTNWIALSLDSSLKHYCQMLKALIHPHPLLASLTRAGVSCLLRLL